MAKARSLTAEQSAAIQATGKVIVSASAGSGKTFVMIERLTRYIQSGGDLDDVLAVTFTKKAAAQMKEKLRSSLIDRARAEDCGERERAHIKAQLAKIPSANISTIHSFCVYLLRTHFYLLDVDGSFDIVSEDNGAEKQLRARAMDAVFDRMYESGDKNFMLVLSCYTKKRSDNSLRKQLSAAYNCIRIYGDYEEKLKNTADTYTPQKFGEICQKFAAIHSERCRAMRSEFDEFMKTFTIGVKPEVFAQIADGVYGYLGTAIERKDIFDPLPPFDLPRRPAIKKDLEEDKAASDAFDEIRKRAKAVYEAYKDLTDRAEEERKFLQSGNLAQAFSYLLLEFDREYAAIKREEGKLDYSDLEHFTLKLLKDEAVRKEVSSGFKQVFVDEYQDVNPVQEAIISAVSGSNLFLVGDVKQAIYSFRGSRSRCFTDKIAQFSSEEGACALSLSSNFRSAPAIIEGVNGLFSQLMRPDTCGINYAKDGVMKSGGAYPQSGAVALHIYGNEEKIRVDELPVYSVADAAAGKAPLSREGMAVAEIVKREIGSSFYDLETGAEREVTPADICVLMRKGSNKAAAEVVRALTSMGIPVSGASGGNVLISPECKQITDILSYIDNGEQDVPMASALLSPVGGFTENELAAIRIACAEKSAPFRDACRSYVDCRNDDISEKLKSFYQKIADYRRLSALFGAATVIDKILSDGAMEAAYMRDGGKKIKNVRRLAAEAVTSSGELSIREFLDRITTDGFRLAAPQSGGGDSVKVMTMHSSKGLEFPVVILGDVCRTFGGGENDEIPYDETYGFVHKTFDIENRRYSDNILLKLQSAISKAEDIKSEMNVLYVACTRAKFRMHILASEKVDFSPYAAAYSSDHAHMLDMDILPTDNIQPEARPQEDGGSMVVGKADEAVLKKLRAHYKLPYTYAASIDLPVKSSASAILRMQQEDYFPSYTLFPEVDGETGAERGTAYHRFLQLCNFAVKDAAGIQKQIENFVKEGLMAGEQAALLDVENLVKILGMKVFARTGEGRLYREQEFLCSLPASEFLETDATDGVMVQGAIDLLRVGSDADIIDYKYSKKGDNALIKTYAKQLELYRSAVHKITGIPKDKISATIVNIFTLREIPLKQ